MAALLLAAAAGAGLAGCSNPLAESPDDLGQRPARERLRDVAALRLEDFRAATNPSGIRTDTSLGAGETLSTTTAEIAPGVTPPSAMRSSADAGVDAARGSVALTLDDCRAEALRHNLDLAVALVDPLIAAEGLAAERAKFEAVFRPAVGLAVSDRPAFSATAANQQDSRFISGAVDIPLRTGGRAEVALTGTLAETAASPFFPSTAYTSALELSLAQPLLRGAGREVNTASITRAAYQADIVEAGTKLQVIAVAAAAERAYWRFSAARDELGVRQKQYELATAQLERARRRFAAGEAPELDVTRAESGLASRLEAIIIAETNALLAQRELKRVMNSPRWPVGGDGGAGARAAGAAAGGSGSGEPLGVITATAPSPVPFDLDAAALVEAALAARAELLQAELQILQDVLDQKVAANRTLPLVELVLDHRYDALGQSFGELRGEFARAKFQGSSVTLRGEVPLGNQRAEAELRRAVLVRLQRLAGREARAQSIRQEVFDAVDRVRLGWQRVLASRQAVTLAARTLEGEQRQFDAGERTSTDVLDAAASLAESESARVRAETDYQIALVDLAVATGTVLGKAGVTWAPAAPPDPTPPPARKDPEPLP